MILFPWKKSKTTFLLKNLIIFSFSPQKKFLALPLFIVLLISIDWLVYFSLDKIISYLQWCVYKYVVFLFVLSEQNNLFGLLFSVCGDLFVMTCDAIYLNLLSWKVLAKMKYLVTCLVIAMI